MTAKTIHQLLHYFITLVWIGNGLFCKVLNGVPRHQQIIGQILGDNYTTTDIQQTQIDAFTQVHSNHSDFQVRVATNSEAIVLPPNSPFSN